MLLWFRNDIRIHDNAALDYALKNGCKKAIFLATPLQWKKHHQSPIKIDFLLRHIQWLSQALSGLGIELSVINVADFAGQEAYIKNHFSGVTIVANSEVELNEMDRDKHLLESGIALTLFESDVILKKGEVVNLDGNMYKVFTPFKQAWLKTVRDKGFDYIPKYDIATNINGHNESVEQKKHLELIETIKQAYQCVCSRKWPLVSDVESVAIPQFFAEKFADYHTYRDIPSIKGTSGLSPYFAIGALSPRYVLRIILQRYPDILMEDKSNHFTWLNELIWREFYRHLLFHFPNLCKGDNFRAKYNELPWPNDEAYFDAWKAGRTGYPIVDAAMRQLNQTGWMHNRLRMIVASFLTKHLLIDWRLGEQYFNEKLIDSDFAANNGGWQWSAGTGCDAQPYFRVFNPITQSEKFDPDGTFIRKYLPELGQVPHKFLHFPHDYIKSQGITCYWDPIVEHKTARLSALAFYKKYS